MLNISSYLKEAALSCPANPRFVDVMKREQKRIRERDRKIQEKIKKED